MSIFEKIFSVKNINIHKVVTFCGLKMKFKSKKLTERKKYQHFEQQIQELNNNVERQTQAYNQQIQELNDNVERRTQAYNQQIQELNDKFKNQVEIYNQQILELNDNNNKLQNILNYYINNLNDNIFKKHQKVVYTCITGSYDNLIQHKYISQEHDYICFTDNEGLLEKKYVGHWQIKPLLFNQLDNTRNNRWHKINYFNCVSEYLESIYLDANIDILTDYIFKTIKNSQKNLLIPQHFRNDCIFQECNYVLECKRESKENVEKAREFLKSQNMPKNYGLTENNIIYRNHSCEYLQHIMKDWFECIEKYSKRDQLSCSYVMWKNGIKIQDILIPNARIDTKNFLMFDHTNS